MKEMIEAVKGLRHRWQESEIGRIETLMLLALAVGLLIASVGFFFGKPCSKIPMFLGFAFSALGALAVSWKQALRFMGVVGLVLIATMFTFSYVGTDAINYHYPMQRLLIEGWNPVFQSSIEKFSQLSTQGRFSLYHTLFLPKVTSLCGALIALSTNLFAGDAFLGYVLIFTLWSVSSLFAKIQWGCASWVSWAFAATITFSSKITSFLAGQVDYTAYAAFIIGLFSFLIWKKRGVLGDLVLGALGFTFAMLAKSTGMVCGILSILIGCIWVRRNIHFYWIIFAMSLFIVIVGASPLLTAWIQYGSPFYPSMTFDPTVPIVDITSDFVGNADGESMGYFSRIIYAWFSKSLAIKGCAWLSGNSCFSPEFYVCGGVGGFGSWFSLMMLGSVFAFSVSRKNTVFLLSLFIFFTANLAPLKYIGYSRYFSQIWVIPFLAAFNLIYEPYPWIAKYIKPLRNCVVIGCVLFVSLFALRTVAYQGRMFVMEWERQQRFEEMLQVSSEWRLDSQRSYEYTYLKRVESSGIRVTENPTAPVLVYNTQFVMPGEDVILSELFPVCDSLQELFRFPWIRAYRYIPHPLWRN